MDKLRNNPLKYIKILTLIYLASSIILDTLHYSVLALMLPLTIGDIFGFLVSYIPFVLFTFYIFKFYLKNRSHLLLTLTYGISALFGMITLISNIAQLKYIFYWDTFQQWLYYGCVEKIISVIFGVIILAITIFNTVNCIAKFKYLRASQTLILLQAIMTVISISITISIHIIVGKPITFLAITGWFMNLTSLISMSAYVVFWKFGVSATSTTPTENALYTIKKQLDEGIISVEEYNTKKEEILSKL